MSYMTRLPKSALRFCTGPTEISRYVGTRRGFPIRLKRLKPRVPDFGGAQTFGSKDNFLHFCKHYICIFVLVQRTFFYYATNIRYL